MNYFSSLRHAGWKPILGLLAMKPTLFLPILCLSLLACTTRSIQYSPVETLAANTPSAKIYLIKTALDGGWTKVQSVAGVGQRGWRGAEPGLGLSISRSCGAAGDCWTIIRCCPAGGTNEKEKKKKITNCTADRADSIPQPLADSMSIGGQCAAGAPPHSSLWSVVGQDPQDAGWLAWG
ncbi:MAG: hypothetical protein AAF399_27035 [Bacteroidota bacterium]